MSHYISSTEPQSGPCLPRRRIRLTKVLHPLPRQRQKLLTKHPPVLPHIRHLGPRPPLQPTINASIQRPQQILLVDRHLLPVPLFRRRLVVMPPLELLQEEHRKRDEGKFNISCSLGWTDSEWGLRRHPCDQRRSQSWEVHSPRHEDVDLARHRGFWSNF